MRLLKLLPGLLALHSLVGCQFDPGARAGDGAIDAGFALGPDASHLGDGGTGRSDAAPVADASPDARCPFDFVDACALGGGGADLDIAGDRVLDTDVDALCETYTQTGGPDACLVHVGSLSIGAGSSLTAIGSRPLVVVADGTIEIAGLLDVSSRRDGVPGAGANAADCAHTAVPEEDVGGAAGGAGGSFTAAGGNGGVGDNDSSIGADGTAEGGVAGMPVAPPTVARGGCPGAVGGNESLGGGQGGAGGAAGGAVFLAARVRIEVTASGAVHAGGAGGSGGEEQAGGGGAGSGGMIGFESPQIVVAGVVAANGGGGGGGGARIGGTPTSGGNGGDAALGPIGATAGDGASPLVGEGDGGVGSSVAVAGGGAGGTSRAGAGGGGGASGVIYTVGALSGLGTFSPARTSPP